MNIPIVYIAVPKRVPWERVLVISRIIYEQGGTPIAWSRGSHYTDLKLRQADALVVIACDGGNYGKWNTLIEHIDRGTRTELQTAIALQKPIFKAYESTEGPGIYAAKSDGTLFYGIVGRQALRHYIEEGFNKEKPLMKKDSNTNVLAELKKKYGVSRPAGEYYDALKGDVVIEWSTEEKTIIPKIPTEQELKQLDRRLLL